MGVRFVLWTVLCCCMLFTLGIQPQQSASDSTVVQASSKYRVPSGLLGGAPKQRTRRRVARSARVPTRRCMGAPQGCLLHARQLGYTSRLEIRCYS